MKKLLILGAGTGGTILANTLSRKLDAKQWDVTVIDKAVEYLYQPGFIFIPFRLYGYNNKSDVVHPVRRHLPGDPLLPSHMSFTGKDISFLVPELAK